MHSSNLNDSMKANERGEQEWNYDGNNDKNIRIEAVQKTTDERGNVYPDDAGSTQTRAYRYLHRSLDVQFCEFFTHPQNDGKVDR